MKNAYVNGVVFPILTALLKALGQVLLRCFTIVTVRTKVLVAILINLLVQYIVFYQNFVCCWCQNLKNYSWSRLRYNELITKRQSSRFLAFP